MSPYNIYGYRRNVLIQLCSMCFTSLYNGHVDRQSRDRISPYVRDIAKRISLIVSDQEGQLEIYIQLLLYSVLSLST